MPGFNWYWGLTRQSWIENAYTGLDGGTDGGTSTDCDQGGLNCQYASTGDGLYKKLCYVASHAARNATGYYDSDAPCLPVNLGWWFYPVDAYSVNKFRACAIHRRVPPNSDAGEAGFEK